MSFSQDVKDELVRQKLKSRHCMIAELSAIVAILGHVKASEGGVSLVVETENTGVAKRYISLVKELFSYQIAMDVREGIRLNHSYLITLVIDDAEQVKTVMSAIKMVDADGTPCEIKGLVNPIVIQKECCKRAFVRGAFISAGSVSDPEKAYHFEIVLTTEERAKQTKEVLDFFGLEAKVAARKNHFLAYIKESEKITDVLGVMEAFNALMALENVRIVKNMRNNVNRKVNCETANINKTVNASVRQIEAIEYIKKTVGLDYLTPALEEIAQVRLENPEAPLSELGTLLSKPVGKSGVNHRLRKIVEIAEELGQ